MKSGFKEMKGALIEASLESQTSRQTAGDKGD
jgi:hypothetical protein